MQPVSLNPGRVVALVACLSLAACTDAETRRQQAYDRAEALAGQGRYAESILEYRKAVRADARFAQGRVRLADAWLAIGNRDAAYLEYVRAADLLPDRVDLQLKAAAYHLMARELPDARARLEALVARHPGDVAALVLLGQTLAELDDHDAAVRAVEQAVHLEPAHAVAQAMRAELYRARGDHDRAEEAYRAALDAGPSMLRVWVAYGNYRLSVNDIDGARDAFERAAALDPSDHFVRRALAIALLASGQDVQAERHLVALSEAPRDGQARFTLADYYHRQGRAGAARAVLAPMRDAAGTFAEVAGRLARLDYEEGHPARALAALDGVLAREPNHAPTLLLKAHWFASDGQWEAARQQALSAVNADPRSPAARYLLGIAQAETGREAQAIVSFNEVLTLDPFSAPAQVQLSRLQLARGEADSAWQLAQDALRNNPGSRDARLALARSLLASGRLAAARTEVGALLASDADEVDGQLLHGILRLEEDDLAGARTAFLRAAELDVTHPEASLGLAMVHLREGDLMSAVARLDMRLHADTARPAWLVVAARVYAAAGDLDGAEAALRRAITIDDAHVEAYRMLGDVYAAQGRLDVAVGELDHAARSVSGVAERTMAALIRHAQGRIADATARYRDILARDPDAAVAGNNLAALYAEEGEQLDLAVELATRASERLASEPDVWDTLGWIHYRKQVPAMAIRHFERAIEAAPESPVYRYRLGLALAAHGDVTGARTAFETVLSIDPAFAEARRALADVQRASRP